METSNSPAQNGKETYAQWLKKMYDEQKERWVPWLEDLYLRYFTRDTKASYAAQQNLDKLKVTGVDQIDSAQDATSHLVTGQLGQDGLGASVGNLLSKEGINRVERKGKDEDGSYIPKETGPVAQGGNAVMGGAAEGSRQLAGAVQGGVKGAGSMLGLGGRE